MPGPYRHFDRLQAACAGLAPMPTAVVCPDDAYSLQGALAARDAGLIVPILIGDPGRIRAAADAAGANLDGLELVDAADATGTAAAAAAVGLVGDGRARAIMKGNLHSDTLLGQVVRQDGGPIAGLYAAGELLGTAQLMGSAFCGGMNVMPALTYGRLLGQKLPVSA